MNNLTKKITFYIFIFFSAILVLSISYFSYKLFWAPPAKIDLSALKTDKEFQDILEQMEKDRLEKIKNKKVEYVEYTPPSCFADGKEYPDGAKKIFYSKSFVDVKESCSKFATEKVCDESFWLGNDNYNFLSCSRDVDCKLADGSIIKNEESIEMFSKEVVPYGDNCNKYKGTRLCKETILTGGDYYKYKECTTSNKGVCKIKDAGGKNYIIPNNRTKLMYSRSLVEYDDNCEKYGKKRMCSEGVFYGDKKFNYLDCQKKKAQDCIVSGITIKHGSSKTLYSRENYYKLKGCRFFAQIRECKNGVLLGDEKYIYEACSDK